MHNPAADLHELFAEWKNNLKDGNRTAAQSRGESRTNSFALGVNLAATKHFNGVIAALEELEAQNYNVGMYKKYVLSWGSMVFNFPYPWVGTNLDADSVFPSADLDMLHALSGVLQMRQPRLRPDVTDQVRKLVLEVLDLVASDETISPELGAYLSRLAREMHAAVEDEQLPVGFDLEEAVQRLWVGLHAAAGQSTDEDLKGRWRDAAGHIFVSAAGSALGSAPGLLMGALGM